MRGRGRRGRRRRRRRHLGCRQGHRQRDIGQLDHVGRPDHVQAARRGGHDARRRLELGDGQFRLTVGALLEGELVLQGGQPHLAVGQHGLCHDHRQERRQHEADRGDVQQPPAPGHRTRPRPSPRPWVWPRTRTPPPGRSRPGMTRSGGRRVAGVGAAVPAPRPRRCEGLVAPVCRRAGAAADAGGGAISPRPFARWPAVGRSRLAGSRRSPPATACARRGRRGGDGRPHRTHRASPAGRHSHRTPLRRRPAS